MGRFDRIETERLLLRRLTGGDADSLADLDADPEVMRYLNGGVPTPRAVIEQRVLPCFLRSYAQREGYGVWAAIEKSTGDFLGWFSFQPSDGDAVGDITLGYRLRRSAWGKGYATEGARALIRKGYTELDAQRVSATTYQDNLGSRRVMEKAGMRLARAYRLTAADLAAEGDSFVPAQEVWDGDDVEYALSKAEWQESVREEEA